MLEQHGHCEVPAGCGGVVLRWRNPSATRLFHVYVYSPWEVPWRIDGREVTNTLVDLAVGDHVLSLHVGRADLSLFRLMFALVPGPHSQAGAEEPPIKLLSAADGTAKCTLTDPGGDAWTKPGYGDAGWSQLRAVQTPSLDWQDFGAYALRCCQDAGAACLALPRPPRKRSALWVRNAFIVPAPDLSGATS